MHQAHQYSAHKCKLTHMDNVSHAKYSIRRNQVNTVHTCSICLTLLYSHADGEEDLAMHCCDIDLELQLQRLQRCEEYWRRARLQWGRELQPPAYSKSDRGNTSKVGAVLDRPTS